MHTKQEEWLQLVKDTLVYLDEQPISTPLFGSAQEAAFFQKKPIFSAPKEKPKPIFLGKIEEVNNKSPLAPTAFPKKPAREVPLSAPPAEEKNPSLQEKLSKKKEDTASLSLEALKEVFHSIAPGLSVKEEIPNDRVGLQRAQQWKYSSQAFPITLLSISENKKVLDFLHAIAKAIDNYFFPSRVVDALSLEKENQWEGFLAAPHVKLLIVSQTSFWALPHLRTFYREYPARSEVFLGTIPLFLLPNPELYLKDPLLKPALWKALCHKISLLPS